jgi:HD-GYP domain-containing protein (c-di-GMP phosphodiesterase class II)
LWADCKRLPERDHSRVPDASPVSAFRRSISSLLSGLEAKDPSYHGHAERLAKIMTAIGRHLSFDQGRLTALVLTAHLHDVGKVAIPDELLLKRGALTPAEYEAVKGHCLSGWRLVQAAGLNEIGTWIRSHHERWDGTGYPDGLGGEEIPLESRILGIADALDAMTAPRVYREPVTAADAADELERCAGDQFDPELATWVASALRSGELEVGSRTMRPRDLALMLKAS